MILQVELGIGCSHVELVGFWLAFSYLGQYDNSVYLIGIFMFFFTAMLDWQMVFRLSGGRQNWIMV